MLSDIDVLHVTECFEGGVSRAIASLVDSTPHLRHGLLAAGKDLSDPEYTNRFAACVSFRQGSVSRILQTRRVARRFRPTHVHAHSSWAGVYVRSAVSPGPGIIYQPHGYAFEKRNVALRVTFFLAEFLLAQRRQTIVVLSPRERRLSQLLNPRAEIAYLPNVATVPASGPKHFGGPDDGVAKRVGMVGRLSAQKDPGFFVSAVRHLRSLNPAVTAVWIGDGDRELRQLMERNQITVTGWLDGRELINCLDSLTLYLHTASYEGFPLSVLDAASRGRGVIVRQIAAFADTELCSAASPQEMARLSQCYFVDKSFAADVRRRGEGLLDEMNPTRLQSAANALYGHGKKKAYTP